MVTGQSFFPADIRNTLGKAPSPRILVTTPVHLRYLLEGVNDLPSVKLVVSATAPLALDLAKQVEAALATPLIEIYGSTETGQIASRRLARSDEWQLFPGIRFAQEGDTTLASGGHIEKPIAMSDVIENLGEGRFRLHGRKADLVNIAGKRNSLAYLNLQLTAIAGVVDGVFFVPDEADTTDVARLAAFVVAPGLTQASLMAALRERIDPVFLPRPLILVGALPRNSTGKLPHAALQALLNETAGRAP
jgi:acyl-coenzyme A synthetase/AMP-(fatty) acid ligase